MYCDCKLYVTLPHDIEGWSAMSELHKNTNSHNNRKTIKVKQLSLSFSSTCLQKIERTLNAANQTMDQIQNSQQTMGSTINNVATAFRVLSTKYS